MYIYIYIYIPLNSSFESIRFFFVCLDEMWNRKIIFLFFSHSSANSFSSNRAKNQESSNNYPIQCKRSFKNIVYSYIISDLREKNTVRVVSRLYLHRIFLKGGGRYVDRHSIARKEKGEKLEVRRIVSIVRVKVALSIRFYNWYNMLSYTGVHTWRDRVFSFHLYTSLDWYGATVFTVQHWIIDRLSLLTSLYSFSRLFSPRAVISIIQCVQW